MEDHIAKIKRNNKAVKKGSTNKSALKLAQRFILDLSIFKPVVSAGFGVSKVVSPG